MPSQIKSSSMSELLARPALASRFDILKTIGEGAAGVVYLVRDRQNPETPVALKLLARDGAFDENTIERFKNEFQICQKIRHPNLIEAYDFFDLQDTAAFTMEFVDGADLGKIFRERKLSVGQIEVLFEQLLSAVEELHQHDVLHRDIKMENVLVRRDGVVKLSDLGLMKQWQRNLTRTGVLLGTAHYFPPEYVREGKYDQRSEIFTLGVMLYELVSGDRWLRDMPGNRVIEHLIKTHFQFPLDTLADLSPKLMKVLERSLQYKAANRFQTVGDMKAGLAGEFPETIANSGKIMPWDDKGAPAPAVSGQVDSQATPRRSLARQMFFLVWIVGSVALLAIALTLLVMRENSAAATAKDPQIGNKNAPTINSVMPSEKQGAAPTARLPQRGK